MTPATFVFNKAVKGQKKLRMALDGITGGGKTWTALLVAQYLAEKEGGRVAGIDSERSSMTLYAPYFDFDHLTLPDFNPHTYIAAIRAAIEQEYAVILVDSLTHAWEGTLDLKDRVAKRSSSNDSFGAWREVTPVHNELVDLLLRAPCHVIVTMRTKMEHLVEKDANGRTVITKVGLRPQQREGVEYEFDLVGDMDQENTMVVSKSRCADLAGAVVQKPGKHFAETVWDWLVAGEPVVGAAEADAIMQSLNAIEDAELRTRSKHEFVARFGRPEALLASRVDEAVAWVEALLPSAAGEPPPAPAAEEPPRRRAPRPREQTADDTAQDIAGAPQWCQDIVARASELGLNRGQLCAAVHHVTGGRALSAREVTKRESSQVNAFFTSMQEDGVRIEPSEAGVEGYEVVLP